LNGKGIEFCYECDEFEKGGCEGWKRLAKGHAKIEMNLCENLLFIKSEGVEKWLERQDKRWRCHSCGKPISEEEKCYQCGTQIY